MAVVAGEVFVRSLPEEVVGGAEELHVLAVDDSLVDRKVIERLLKISCCKVTAVESAMRALQYLGLDGEKSNGSVGFNDLKVNLIMTDYSMPGMTGYELLKRIKESSAFREIPVVVMSSENILTRIDRCLEEGAEDFLVKPVKLSDVKRLKDFIMRGVVGEEEGKRTTLKRKMQDNIFSLSTTPSPSSCDLLSTEPPMSPSSPSSCDLMSSEPPMSPSSVLRSTKLPKLQSRDQL